jgi:hypothetical protein
MNNIFQNINKDKLASTLIEEIMKLPFGSLPKNELELILFHSHN